MKIDRLTFGTLMIKSFETEIFSSSCIRSEKHSNLQYSTTEVMTITILTVLMTGIVTLELMAGFAGLIVIVSGLIQILNVMIDNSPSAKSGYDK